MTSPFKTTTRVIPQELCLGTIRRVITWRLNLAIGLCRLGDLFQCLVRQILIFGSKGADRNIAEREDAHQLLIVIEYRQPSYLMSFHYRSGFLDGLIVEAVNDVGRHDLADFARGRVAAFCD
jgi:hypothetical protein